MISTIHLSIRCMASKDLSSFKEEYLSAVYFAKTKYHRRFDETGAWPVAFFGQTMLFLGPFRKLVFLSFVIYV